MVRTMERLYNDIAAHDVFLEKLSCLLGGIQEQILDIGDMTPLPENVVSHINSVFDRFERSRNKIQIALQTTGVMPVAEPDVKPTGEPKPVAHPPEYHSPNLRPGDPEYHKDPGMTTPRKPDPVPHKPEPKSPPPPVTREPRK